MQKIIMALITMNILENIITKANKRGVCFELTGTLRLMFKDYEAMKQWANNNDLIIKPEKPNIQSYEGFEACREFAFYPKKKTCP